MKTKRKTKVSPTQMTMKYLRDRGCACAVLEHWVPAQWANGGGFRKDIWGGDLMALVGQDTIVIQAGVGSAHAAKITKAITLDEVRQWLTGSEYRKFHVWTWSKRVAFNKSGAKSKRDKWTPRVTQIILRDGELIAQDFTLKG